VSGLAAGDLDRRIIIQRATVTKGTHNADVETWIVLARVWAGKKDVSDRERVAAAEVAAEITTRFVIRWSSVVEDVGPRDRVVYDGRIYDISAVKEIGRRDGLEISAAARAD